MQIHKPEVPTDIKENINNIVNQQIKKSDYFSMADYIESRKQLTTQLVTIASGFENACEIGMMVDGNPMDHNGNPTKDCFAYKLWEFMHSQLLTCYKFNCEKARDTHIITETTKYILRQGLSSELYPGNDTLYATNANYYRLKNVLSAIKVEIGLFATRDTIRQSIEDMKQNKMIQLDNNRDKLVQLINKDCSRTISFTN